MTMTFTGSARKIADTDLPRLGETIGVGEDEVHAFLDVETNGGGYDKLGRPKMLFEPHKFFAHTSGSARASAVAAGVAYATQGEQPYPNDSYPRLLTAIYLNQDAALKSASWGIGQVMGENYVAAGYKDVQSFVQAMIDGGEAAQLAAAISFIKSDHLDDELRAHNWAAFARGYNGAGYARNAYDAKLAKAYAKWKAIRDTPWSPSADVTLPQALNATPEAPVVAVPIAATPGKPAVPPVVAPAPPAPQTWAAWLASTFFRRA